MSEAALTCPHCGAAVYATDDQCLACGAHLDEGQDVNVAPALEVDAPGLPYPVLPGAQPWDPLELGTGGGFFERLARGWAFLGQSWSLLGQDGRLLLPSVVSILVSFVMLAGMIALLHATGLDKEFAAEQSETSPKLIFVGMIFGLVGYTVTYLFQAWTIDLVAALLRGQRQEMGFGFWDGLRNLPAMVLLSLASVVVGMIASAIRGRNRSWVQAQAAEVVQSAWNTFVYLTLPVIILEDAGLFAAFGRAKSLHSRHVGDLLVAWIGVGLINRVIGMLVILPALLGAWALISLVGPATLPLAVAIVIAAILGVSIFTNYINAAYFTCLYLWAEAAEKAQGPVPAPAPLAALAL